MLTSHQRLLIVGGENLRRVLISVDEALVEISTTTSMSMKLVGAWLLMVESEFTTRCEMEICCILDVIDLTTSLQIRIYCEAFNSLKILHKADTHTKAQIHQIQQSKIFRQDKVD
jgi:hypothetical protein